jgi:hypothetical protein
MAQRKLVGAGEAGRQLTVELKELVVAGLGRELLAVDDSLLESVTLRGGHFDFWWLVL